MEKNNLITLTIELGQFDIDIEDNNILNIYKVEVDEQDGETIRNRVANIVDKELSGQDISLLITELTTSRVKSEFIISEYEEKIDKLYEELEAANDKIAEAANFIEENRGKLE